MKGLNITVSYFLFTKFSPVDGGHGTCGKEILYLMRWSLFEVKWKKGQQLACMPVASDIMVIMRALR
jgi:hypothetical protein